MSKKGELAAVEKLIGSDVAIDLDAVVSVYVSQYEDQLFTKKKELSKTIKGVKDDLKIQEKTLERSIDKTEYDISVPVLNLISKVESININWKNEDDGYVGSTIKVEVRVSEKEKTDRWSADSLTTTRKVKVSSKTLKDKTAWEKQLEGLNAELLEVMSAIKGVSRKERQVKGKISGMKLEAGGFADLLNSPDLLALVKLD